MHANSVPTLRFHLQLLPHPAQHYSFPMSPMSGALLIYFFNPLTPFSVTSMCISYWNMGCVSEALYLKIILPNLIQRTDEMLYWTKTLGLKEKSKQLKFNP